MATRNLIRAGASLLNRVSCNPLLHQTPKPNQRVVSQGFEITPQLFPSLSKLQASLHLHQSHAASLYLHPSDADSLSKLSSQGFLYPSGLPSLPFFLPDGDSSSEPMLLVPKRTFQPSTIRRKRNHGFFARKATKGGRKVIARRIAKGRSRITA